MRLTAEQANTIRQLAAQVAGESARVWLFGSRVRDSARGGDVDLMVELANPVDEPAPLAARLAALVSRSMQGRKVDVLIKAPNLLLLPVHQVAMEQGVLL